MHGHVMRAALCTFIWEASGQSACHSKPSGKQALRLAVHLCPVYKTAPHDAIVALILHRLHQCLLKHGCCYWLLTLLAAVVMDMRIAPSHWHANCLIPPGCCTQSTVITAALSVVDQRPFQGVSLLRS